MGERFAHSVLAREFEGDYFKKPLGV